MNAPEQDLVRLWVLREPEQESPELAERQSALLDAEERARWQRFLYPRDRQRFLSGRAMLRCVLAELLGESDPGALRFSLNPHGKPLLADPKARQLQFNLSHTDGLVVLATASRHAVGVDVESLGRKVEMLALSARYFTGREHAALEELEGNEQRERFFALWTLKEAWLKARGFGLHIPLDDFSFSFAGKTPLIHFGPQLDEQPEEWQFRLLSQSPDYRIAVAVHCKANLPLKVDVQEWRMT